MYRTISIGNWLMGNFAVHGNGVLVEGWKFVVWKREFTLLSSNV